MNSINNKLIISVVLNILVWVLVLLFPLFAPWMYDGEINWTKFCPHIAHTAFFAMLFYFNFLYFTDRYFFRKKYIQYVLVNILVCFAFTILIYYITKYFRSMDPAIHHIAHRCHKNGFLFFWHRNISTFVSFFLCFLLGLGMKMVYSWMASDKKIMHLNNLHMQSELETIKYQFSPHFLLNTLNNIYTLVSLDNKTLAQENILRLASLLRYVLYEMNSKEVMLVKEVEFYKDYVGLMKIRQSDKIEVKLDIDLQENTTRKIVPLIFIGLIENAFKHGISASEPSFINIKIEELENSLICCVENSDFHVEHPDRDGIGIKQTLTRLDMLYKDKYSYNVTKRCNIYKVLLVINF